MKFITVEYWDEELWEKARDIYNRAFEGKGAKPEKIIKNMFNKNICTLHVGMKHSEVITMALIGKLDESKILLIDYLAVRQVYQNKGIGQLFLNYIKEWSIANGRFESMIIEVESENSEENRKRIRFWENSGFILTDYIHHYIWVPEPYRAMYVKLHPVASLPENGEHLFEYITRFHKLSFQGS